MTYPDPPSCYRCGVPGHVDWVDVATFADMPGTVWIVGNQWCITSGCVDEHGSRTLFAPTPGELRDREQRAWFARQRGLAEER
jgi:hypothetical protein